MTPDRLLLLIVLSVSTLLTSALFLVSLSPHPLASRRPTQTLVCEESRNSPTTSNSSETGRSLILSYEELMTDDKEVFVYLDPPYDIKSILYGKRGNMHAGFDHDEFYFDCDSSSVIKWSLTTLLILSSLDLLTGNLMSSTTPTQCDQSVSI